MKRLSLTLLLSFVLNYAFCQATQYSYGGERRRFILYLPASYKQDTTTSFPLVFNFHGGGMTMTEQMFYSGMNRAAEKHQFMVVYPQGIKQDWNVGFEMSYQKGTDDVGYIEALLKTLMKDYRVLKTQVYATGLSRGGFFCHRLAAELPETFAAIASVGAPIPDSVVYFHKKKTEIGVLLIQGNKDAIVDYNGKVGAYMSAERTYGYWKKHNSLENATERKQLINRIEGDSTSVRILETASSYVSVSLVTIEGGGHTWPGSDPFNIGFPLGRTSKEIDVNETIWKFLSRHKRKDPNK